MLRVPEEGKDAYSETKAFRNCNFYILPILHKLREDPMCKDKILVAQEED